MSCGLLPLCYDAMALGEVPFIDVDTADQQQLADAIGTTSKVIYHLYHSDLLRYAIYELYLETKALLTVFRHC